MQRMGSSEAGRVKPVTSEPGGQVGAQVSIVMAVHGNVTWLSAALDSILRQTFESWEFRCVLDGPNMEAESIIETFGTRFPYVILPRHLGGPAARALALEAATG